MRGSLSSNIILVCPLAIRSNFSLIPSHKNTLWDSSLGSQFGYLFLFLFLNSTLSPRNRSTPFLFLLLYLLEKDLNKLTNRNTLIRLPPYLHKSAPYSLALDLTLRVGIDWEGLSKRFGWLTFEDFKSVDRDCCKWLD